MRRLARRDQAVAELRAGLERAGHEEADIDQALTRLQERRLVDDGRYAERFARAALRGKGWGSRRIVADLRLRGVAREHIREGLQEALDVHPEDKVLDAVAQSWWRRHPGGETDKRVTRLWAFLLRRGFPPELVRGRLRVLLPELEGRISDLDSPCDEGGS
jgi:regulatory protein